MPQRLDDPCRFLKGVGPRRAEVLERLRVRTVEDLLLHLPRSYYDRRQLVPVCSLQPGNQACVRVRVESLQARPPWPGRSTHVATVADDTGRLRVVWFNSWVAEVLRPGNQVVLAGPVVEQRGRLEMRQPEFELLEQETQELLHAGRIVPLYPLTRGVSQKWLRALVRRALDLYLPCVHEVLPETVRNAMPERRAAFAGVHFPATPEEAEAARGRLKFEELFLFQLLVARRRLHTSRHVRGVPMQRQRGLHERYLTALPFALTGAQRRVLEDIYADLESGRWMQRLVQGDVGSGKTVIAAAALMLVVGNGWQGAFMAPTETLAVQHAERLAPACESLGVRLDLLTGSRSERDKEILRGRMARGDVDLVIGTHALIQEGVEWARLGLAVVDEQQRFGVLQRGVLQRGAERPHVLVLSATPIPRSLALVLYGDLDLSVIDELPPGRQPVTTVWVQEGERSRVEAELRMRLARGERAYVVCPVVEESAAELKAAVQTADSYRRGPLGVFGVGLIHGRLPPAEKAATIAAFRQGGIRLLVATTVVEVGVDVPEATAMVIEHADRLGLAQLHQLRGRVGRADRAAICFVVADREEVGEEARARLEALVREHDGLTLAEADLRLRGPGEFFGTRQSGLDGFHLGDLTADLSLLESARAEARAALAEAPALDGAWIAVRKAMEKRWAARLVLGHVG